jgi:hypothetical protein
VGVERPSDVGGLRRAILQTHPLYVQILNEGEIMDNSAKATQEIPTKRYRNIIIEPVLNGFVVTVGCQRLVYSTLKDISVDLKAYEDDPDTIERLLLRQTKYKDSNIQRLEPSTDAPLAGPPYSVGSMVAGLRER